MPKVEMIDTSDLPAVKGSGSMGRQDAIDALKQALHLALGTQERVATIQKHYYEAARELGIRVIILTGPSKRTYIGQKGVERAESDTLYVRITKAKAAPVVGHGDPNILSRRPIDTTPRAPELEPITGALVSR